MKQKDNNVRGGNRPPLRVRVRFNWRRQWSSQKNRKCWWFSGLEEGDFPETEYSVEVSACRWDKGRRYVMKHTGLIRFFRCPEARAYKEGEPWCKCAVMACIKDQAFRRTATLSVKGLGRSSGAMGDKMQQHSFLRNCTELCQDEKKNNTLCVLSGPLGHVWRRDRAIARRHNLCYLILSSFRG